MEFSDIHANVLNLVASAVQNGIISPDDLMEIASAGSSDPPTPIAKNARAVLEFALQNGLLESGDILDLVGNKNSQGSAPPSTRPRPLKERRPLPPDSKPGDWFCPECNNTNFARRKECNICKAPRPSPKLDLGLWPQRDVRDGWPPGDVRDGWRPGPAAYPPRRMLDRGIRPIRQTQESKPKPPETLPGDWLCAECGNTNFARRNVCNIATCKAPRPGPRSPPFDPFSWTRDRGSWVPPMNRFGSVKRRRGEFERPTGRRPRPPASNPGDWLCPECGNTNFARRTECNISTCKAPRPG
jgi:rubredoxin